MMDVDLERVDRGDVEGLAVLRRAAAVSDGVDPFVQVEDLAGDGIPVRHAIRVDDELQAYAAAAPKSGDKSVWNMALVIHPHSRHGGFGELLVNTVADAVEEAGAKRLQCWAPIVTEPVDRLSYRCGFRLTRRLLRLAVALPLPDHIRLPPGYHLDTFADDDIGDVVAVNNAAFSWHPEQGSLTREQLVSASAEEWFDPAGFLLARNEAGELGGFCWTKLHGRRGREGEIYVICTAPDHQGVGLGAALTLAGLEHLSETTKTGMLYVDEGNLVARRLYGSLGFLLDRVPSLFTLDLAERPTYDGSE